VATFGGGAVLDAAVSATPVRAGSGAGAGTLARTGSDVAPFVGVAAALVVLGAVLVALRRAPRGRHQ